MKRILLAISLMAIVSFTNAQNAIPNPGFETWNVNPNYDDPASWGTINGLTYFLGVRTVTKASAAGEFHSGSAAIKLESKTVPLQGTAPGIAATGSINTGGYIDGGLVYTKRPISLTGWYRYTPSGTDTGSIEATLSKWNAGNHTREVVGRAVFEQNVSVGSFTQFTVNFTYNNNNIPDTLVMILLSSSQGNASPAGSKLWVDDLDFVLCNGYTATASSGTNANCTASDGLATVVATNGTGGNTYLWSNNAITAVINVAAGTYTVTATDGNGCSASASTIVGVNSTTITSTITSTATTCGASTGSATVTPTNGTANYSYTWNNGGNTASVNNLGAGGYQVTITDANGCSGTASTTVTTPNGPSATQVTTDISCFGANDGEINVTTTGGTGNITYAWNTSVSTEDLNALSGGTYLLTITDANNCSFTISATVNEPAQLTLSETHNNVLCNGGNDGSIQVTSTGGTPPYAYNSLPTIGNNLTAGTYAVTVTDQNSCSVTASVVVTEPVVLTAQATVVDASSALATDGSITVSAGGGTPNYSYNWNPNVSSTSTASSLAVGTYCVTVTDNNSCTTTVCETVSFSSAIGNISTDKITLNPNPANNLLTIETNAATGKFNFSIFNLEGKLMEQQIIIGGKISVDVKHLPEGFYSYQLQDMDSKELKSGKLVIAR